MQQLLQYKREINIDIGILNLNYLDSSNLKIDWQRGSEINDASEPSQCHVFNWQVNFERFCLVKK